MNIPRQAAYLILALLAGMAFALKPAFAHRFNVALVFSSAIVGADQGRQIHNGFMQATKERDGHPDQESDGHLGGLDVYVSVIDGRNKLGEILNRIAAKGDVNIVVAFGFNNLTSSLRKIPKSKPFVLLVPGQTPFARLEHPAVASVISTYQREFGHRPSAPAAQGYNAARRIELAVRSQGGVDNFKSLLRSFRETERGFTW